MCPRSDDIARQLSLAGSPRAGDRHQPAGSRTQHRQQLCKFELATDQSRRRPHRSRQGRLVGSARRTWHRIHQRGTIDLVEVQRIAECSARARVRAPTISSFESTDGLGGHAGSLGELLLAQRRREAEVPKGLPEVTPTVPSNLDDASEIDHLARAVVRDGSEPLAGQHFVTLSVEFSDWERSLVPGRIVGSPM